MYPCTPGCYTCNHFSPLSFLLAVTVLLDCKNLIVVSSALLNKLIFLQPNPSEMLSISEKPVTQRSGWQRAPVFRFFTGNALNHFVLKPRFFHLQSHQMNPKLSALSLRQQIVNNADKC